MSVLLSVHVICCLSMINKMSGTELLLVDAITNHILKTEDLRLLKVILQHKDVECNTVVIPF